MRILLLAVISLAGYHLPLLADGPDYLAPKLLTGSIYEKPEGRLLFTFRRTATQTGEVVSVLRDFLNPDGSLAAREKVHYERGRLVRFELDELQNGGRGQAAVELSGNQRQRIQLEYATQPGRARRQKSEVVRDQPLISDMLPGLITKHWDELMRGKEVKFRYIVVPRLETIGFKLRRDAPGELHGKKVVRIRMEPASAFIARFVDPLIFTIEAQEPRRILQYWGRTTPKARSGDSWKDLDALTVFDWK